MLGNYFAQLAVTRWHAQINVKNSTLYSENTSLINYRHSVRTSKKKKLRLHFADISRCCWGKS